MKMTIPRTWRWAYTVLALAVGWALAEMLSLGLHPLILGRGFSMQAFSDDRRLARQEDFRDDLSSERPEAFLGEDALNPYLGFTGNPNRDIRFSNLGFWGSLGWPPPTRSTN